MKTIIKVDKDANHIEIKFYKKIWKDQKIETKAKINRKNYITINGICQFNYGTSRKSKLLIEINKLKY